MVDEQDLILDWEFDDTDEGPLEAPAWRRPFLAAVSLLVVAAMAVLPLYNLIDSRPVADNGLELCGFDYCVVQEAVRAAGLEPTMSRLANTYLPDEEARVFAAELVALLGEAPVTVAVVDRLGGRIEGQYDPASRTILVERPVRAWTVLHEAAHVPGGGHGTDFLRTVIGLASQMTASE